MPVLSSPHNEMRYSKVLILALLLIIPSLMILSDTPEVEVKADDNGKTRPTWLDIEVDSVEVVRTSQSNNIYPGQTVDISVKLVHGSRPFQSDTAITRENKFTTILVIDDQIDNVTTMYQTVTSLPTTYTGENPVGQGPNPPYVLNFKYQLPLKLPEGVSTWPEVRFLMHATITVDDDDKSDNYRTGTGLRVSEPQFEPKIWEEGQKEGSPEGPIWDANLGDPLDIDFLLINDGPAVDDIGIQIVDAPEGWIVGGFDPITVYPNDEEELTFFMKIPSNPFLAQADSVYPIIVRAYSNFYPSGPYISDSTHVFRVRIGFKPGIKIVPDIPEGEQYKVPGHTHNLVFSVTNTGNGEDTFTLNSFIDEVHVKKGWKVSNPNPMMKTLAPSESTSVVVKLTIPEDAAKFYYVNVYLSGTSAESGGTYEKLGDPMSIFASTNYAADIEDPDPEGYWVEPGRENTIFFNFTNMGNDKDKEQKLVVERKPIGWAVFIDMTPMVNGVGPRTTVMLKMTVFVSETALTTKFVSPPFVIINALGGPFQHKLDTARFDFIVPERQKIELTSPQPEREGFIGGQVDFILNVRNAGNWVDTFNLSVDSDWARLEEDQVSVAPDETYMIKVSVAIPKDAAADTNPDTPYPNDPDKNWYDGYKIRVTGYSQNETDEGITLRSIELILHVQPFYEFEMDLAEDEPDLKFSTDHDQNRAVRIKLTNTGNIADLIKLDWEDNPYDWLRLQNTYIDLPDNEDAYAVLNINPKKGDVPEVGSINVTLIGSSRNDPEGEKLFKLPLELEFYKMSFEMTDIKKNNIIMEASEFGNIGDTFSFQVNVSNIGSTTLDPTRFDTMYVVLMDGPYEVDRADITYLPIGKFKEVTFSYTFASPGPHSLTFAFEGDVPLSDESDLEVKKNLIIRTGFQEQPEDKELPLWAILIPLLLIIIFVTVITVDVIKYSQIYISPTDTGYDEDGEYRPWAIKEKLEEEEPKELAAPEEKKALPAPAPAGKPGLPPGPGGAPTPSPAAARPPQPMPRPAPGQPAQRPMPGARPAAQPMRPPVPTQGARPPQPMPARPGQPMRPPVPAQVARPPMPPPKQ